MKTKRLTRTVNGKVEEVLLMVWNGVRIMRGTPHPDGPQGSFEKIDLEGAAAEAEAKRRLAAFRAEGFQDIVEEPAPKPKRATAASKKETPSVARPVKAKPRWMKKMPASVEKELAKLRTALGKVGLAHRVAEIEVLTRPGVDLKLKRAKPADIAGVVSRIGGDPDLPPKTPWPADKRTQLGFIAQIVVADFKEHDLEGLLPGAGVLSFFGQLDVSKPGYTDVGAILFSPRADKLVRTASPSGVPRIEKVGIFTPKPRVSLPSLDDPAIERLGLNRDEARAYGNLFSELIPEGRNHTLLGWPTASTMHCMKGRRFVGQLDSDHHLEFEMGDYETLRFYVDGDAVDARAVATAVCTVSEA